MGGNELLLQPLAFDQGCLAAAAKKQPVIEPLQERVRLLLPRPLVASTSTYTTSKPTTPANKAWYFMPQYWQRLLHQTEAEFHQEFPKNLYLGNVHDRPFKQCEQMED